MKITRLEGSSGYDIDVKRFHAPFRIESECACGTTAFLDLSFDYLSHPRLGAPEGVSLYCENCDAYTDIQIVLDITIEAVPCE